MTLLNYIGVYALVAIGLVLLTGVGGVVSFGQAAFVGIAAYATAWLTTTYRPFALARPAAGARLTCGAARAARRASRCA